jgi:glycosyltransferase involved in cell wall biosynthesis
MKSTDSCIDHLSKIKLLIIAPSFYPVHGGAGLRFFRYLPLFHVRAIETTVICGTPKVKKFTFEDHQADWVNASNGELVSEIEIEHAKILKYKIPGEGKKNRTKILLQKAIMLCESNLTKPDVVHVIAPMPFGAIKELRQLKRLGVKLVYSQTIARKYSSNAVIRELQKLKVKSINKCYDSIIAQSCELKEIVLETNAKADVHIIPNGVDIDKFSPIKNGSDKKQLREKLGLTVDATYITLVGAVHPRKGTDLLVEAWSSLVTKYKELHLILIGPRYDETQEELHSFRDNMKQIINVSGRRSNVHFLGPVKNVNEYLQVSDLFVFPSKREGMPNAVLEAMSSGLPVILTPFIGLSDEMGEANKDYLLAKRTSAAIADTILSVLECDSLREELAGRARNWVVNKMNVESSINAHVELYKQLLA